MNKNQSYGIKSLLLVMGITIFCVATALVSIGDVFRTLGRFTACPGAESYVLKDSSGGTVDPVGIKGPYGTKVFQLECKFADGTTKTVENDSLFLYGFLATAIIGAVLGFFIWLWMALNERKKVAEQV